ncbi:unnamed protein product, partial [Schistosoma turkestanicum]
MDFIPNDILREFFQGPRKGVIGSKTKIKSGGSSISEKLPQSTTVSMTAAEGPYEIALKSDSPLRNIISCKTRSYLNNRSYTVYLSKKLSRIVQNKHIREFSPIRNAEQLQSFKEDSSVALRDIQNIFKEVISEICPEHSNRKALLSSLHDIYGNIF